MFFYENECIAVLIKTKFAETELINQHEKKGFANKKYGCLFEFIPVKQ